MPTKAYCENWMHEAIRHCDRNMYMEDLCRCSCNDDTERYYDEDSNDTIHPDRDVGGVLWIRLDWRPIALGKGKPGARCGGQDGRGCDRETGRRNEQRRSGNMRRRRQSHRSHPPARRSSAARPNPPRNRRFTEEIS